MIAQLLGRLMRRVARSTVRLVDAPGTVRPLRIRGEPLLLYVHIPFCEFLCPFCSFHRVRFGERRARDYFVALRREIRHYADLGVSFSDVYVGGGTPTVLPDELSKTLALLRDLGATGRFTVETNPNHLRAPLIDRLADAGVDRLSVGVQTFDDALLEAMGRREPYGSGDDIRRGLTRAHGRFRTLNADLIFNQPHQTRESLARDIATLHDLGIDQASFYPLMPAAATRRAMARQMGLVDFSREREFYFAVLDGMRADYRQSSAWCFTRDQSMLDEYIVDHDEYLGVGSGAFSYLGGTMYSSSFSINRYEERISSGGTGIVMQHRLSRAQVAHYALLVRLFGVRVSRAALERGLDAAARLRLRTELVALAALGAVRHVGDEYRLTERGMYYWVVMMREFFMAVNQFRERMRLHVRHEKRHGVYPVVAAAARLDGHRSVIGRAE